MASSILQYITALIIVLLILFSYCHISRLKTLNNELKILQVVDPDADMVYDLLDKHQPIVFQKEIFYWKEFNHLIGKSLTDIKNTISINKTINYSEYIKNNIDLYNLSLSYDWNIDIKNILLDDKSAIFFNKQNNYMQLFGCVSGEMRVIITKPDQCSLLSPFINMVSSVDATSLLDTEPMVLNYIEIIVRQGNMIYIPWGWCYYIYKIQNAEECVVVDCINKSFLSLI
jgi:hypothetical protein